jgi:CheY-like chemotaxis protein
MSRRILVIDDEEAIREVARASLEIVGGWEVLTSQSGSDGLAAAAAEQPDAILLDVVMPEMDGPTTLQRLQANASTRHIPVILLTARAYMAPDDELSGLGATGVIAKPFDALSLASQVAQTIGWSS